MMVNWAGEDGLNFDDAGNDSISVGEPGDGGLENGQGRMPRAAARSVHQVAQRWIIVPWVIFDT